MQHLPALPRRWVPAGFADVSRGALAVARKAANRTIHAVRAMWEGSFDGAELKLVEGPESMWEDSSPLQRDIALGVLERHLVFGQAGAALRGEDAFRSVIKSSSGVYSLEADAKGTLP